MSSRPLHFSVRSGSGPFVPQSSPRASGSRDDLFTEEYHDTQGHHSEHGTDNGDTLHGHASPLSQLHSDVSLPCTIQCLDIGLAAPEQLYKLSIMELAKRAPCPDYVVSTQWATRASTELLATTATLRRTRKSANGEKGQASGNDVPRAPRTTSVVFGLGSLNANEPTTVLRPMRDTLDIPRDLSNHTPTDASSENTPHAYYPYADHMNEPSVITLAQDVAYEKQWQDILRRNDEIKSMEHKRSLALTRQSLRTARVPKKAKPPVAAISVTPAALSAPITHRPLLPHEIRAQRQAETQATQTHADPAASGSAAAVDSSNTPPQSVPVAPAHVAVQHPDEDNVTSSLLGPIDWRYKCRTCYNHVLTCPGHWGHIELPWPVYHMSFIRQTLKILSMTCYWCCRLKRKPATRDERLHAVRFDEGNNLRLRKQQDLQYAYSHSKNPLSHSCQYCGLPQPSYSITNHKTADSSVTSATLAIVSASAASQVLRPGVRGMITPHRSLMRKNGAQSLDDMALTSTIQSSSNTDDASHSSVDHDDAPSENAVATVSMMTANTTVRSELETIGIQWNSLSHLWAPSAALVEEFAHVEHFVCESHRPREDVDFNFRTPSHSPQIWCVRAYVYSDTSTLQSIIPIASGTIHKHKALSVQWIPKVLLDIAGASMHCGQTDRAYLSMLPMDHAPRPQMGHPWCGDASPRVRIESLGLSQVIAQDTDMCVCASNIQNSCPSGLHGTQQPSIHDHLPCHDTTDLHLNVSQFARLSRLALDVYRRQYMLMNVTHRTKLVQRQFTAKDAHWIFQHMLRDDVWRTGRHPDRAHPAWMIHTVFPVSPMLCRMSVSQTTGSSLRIPSDLTTRLNAIIRTVRALWQWLDARSPIVSPQMWTHVDCLGLAAYPKSLLECIAELQREVAGYVYCSPKTQSKPAYSSSKNAGMESSSKMSKKKTQMMQLVDGPTAVQAQQFVDASSLMDDVVANVTRQSKRTVRAKTTTSVLPTTTTTTTLTTPSFTAISKHASSETLQEIDTMIPAKTRSKRKRADLHPAPKSGMQIYDTAQHDDHVDDDDNNNDHHIDRDSHVRDPNRVNVMGAPNAKRMTTRPNSQTIPSTLDDATIATNATAAVARATSQLGECQLNRLPIGTSGNFLTKILQSVSSSWDGKTGRFRDKIFAKRSDFTARGVIKPGSTGRVQHVGIGPFYAQVLTFPEIVNRYNRAELTRRVLRGCAHADGASTVITRDHGAIQLSHHMRHVCDSLVLQNGWVVERWLTDGDQMILNRNPSLHKYSKQGMEVFRTQGGDETVSIHGGCCTPYGADFDGDEMNMHVPQNHAGRAECRHLMGVARNIICAQRNMVLTRGHQEINLGAFLFTQRGVFLTESQMHHMVLQPQWIYGRVSCDRAMPVVHEDRKPDIRTHVRIEREHTWLPSSHSTHHIGAPAFSYCRRATSSSKHACMREDRWSGKQVISLQFPTSMHYQKAVRDLSIYQRIRKQNRAYASSHPTDHVTTIPSTHDGIHAPSQSYIRDEKWRCHAMMDSLDRHVHIMAGRLVSGSLCNQSIGAANNTVIQALWKDLSNQAAANFLTGITQLAYGYLLVRGFSTGSADMMPGFDGTACARNASPEKATPRRDDTGDQDSYRTMPFGPLQHEIQVMMDLYRTQSDKLWRWLESHIVVHGDATTMHKRNTSHGTDTDNHITQEVPWHMDDQLQSIQQWWIEAIRVTTQSTSRGNNVGVPHMMTITPYAAVKLQSEAAHRIENEGRALFGKTGSMLGHVLARHGTDNSIDRMAISGSKGNRSNFVQMAGFIGPQYCDGLAVGTPDVHCHGRGFSSSLYNDKRPDAMGMITNSFREGMTPRQVVSLIKGLRDALIDSATKTSRTGYIQRRLCQVGNSLSVNFDRTVTDSDDHVIQMVYGGDGMEPMELEHARIPGILVRRALDQCGLYPQFPSKATPYSTTTAFLHPKEAERVEPLIRLVMFEYTQQPTSRFNATHVLENGIEYLAPVSIARLLKRYQFEAAQIPAAQVAQQGPLTQELFIGMIHELCVGLRQYAGDLVHGGCAAFLLHVRLECHWSRNDHIRFAPTSTHDDVHTGATCTATTPTPNRTKTTSWTVKLLQQFCQAVFDAYVFSWCNPGETVGIIGGQSIGEPATQMNMKIWNACGLAKQGMNLMDGIPRLDEILNATEEIRTRGYTVPLDPAWCTNAAQAHLIAQSMIGLHLSDVIADHRQVWLHIDPWMVVDSTTPSHPQCRHDYAKCSQFSFDGVAIDCELTRHHILYAPVVEALRQHDPTFGRAAGPGQHYEQPLSIWTVDPRIDLMECGLSLDQIVARIEAYLVEPHMACATNDDMTGHSQPWHRMCTPQHVARVGPNHIIFWQTIMVHDVPSPDNIVHDPLHAATHDDARINVAQFYFNWSLHGALVELMMRQMQLCGIDGVRSVHLVRPSKTSIYPTECWALLVRGGSLLGVLTHPAVLDAWVTTNDIFAVAHVFGIEAARQTHFSELMRVLGNENRFVQSRHAALFADLLTYYGKVISATRFGLQHTDEGFLKRAGFEEARVVLFNAALNAESDHLSGMIANLFMGSRPTSVGTGRTLLHMEKGKPSHDTMVETTRAQHEQTHVVEMGNVMAYDPDAPPSPMSYNNNATVVPSPTYRASAIERTVLPAPNVQHGHGTGQGHDVAYGARLAETLRVRSYMQSMMDALPSTPTIQSSTLFSS